MLGLPKLVGKEAKRTGFIQLREDVSVVKFQFVLPVLLQDEEMHLRRRRNVPGGEGQASSTGEPG